MPMIVLPSLAKAAASQAEYLAPPENPPKASGAFAAPGRCDASVASAALASARRSGTSSCSRVTSSTGSAATMIQPAPSAVAA
jgi:hypothetical protein